MEFAVVLLCCFGELLSAGELPGIEFPVVLDGGVELVVALGNALAPPVVVAGVLAAADCWPDSGGTLDALFGVEDHAAGGGGGMSASSRDAKGCASLCWVALA
ncbi:MAG TPA: hypothetical protein VMF12_15180, partial [Xanthobacteraceae bacterium]|nr:hypothetical protein [Xanthobacteraceae bacterium]